MLNKLLLNKKKIVIPAPMCGVMDAPFRKIILDFGSDIIYTEMIASHAMTLEHKKEYINRATLKQSGKNTIFVIQLAGCNPDIMAYAAKICEEELGADIIDLNFGCPVKKVTNGYAGSALMKDEKLSEEIIKSVVNAVKIPVTIKMRMGWDFNSLNAAKISEIAENAGIQMITVHGRTRSQLYTGQADWKFVKNIKNIVKVPVIVNGDIKDKNDMKVALEESNADGVMVARGLYGKPWLIKELNNSLCDDSDISSQPQNLWSDCIEKHINYIEDFYDQENSKSYAIKHLFFYSKGIPNGAEFRSKISHNSSINEIRKIALEFFNQ